MSSNREMNVFFKSLAPKGIVKKITMLKMNNGCLARQENIEEGL
jgi:hypothetical protein